MNAREHVAWTASRTPLASPAAASALLLDSDLDLLGLLLPRPSAAC